MSLHINHLIGFGVGGSLRMPEYVSAGAANTSATGTVNVDFPASILAGDILLGSGFGSATGADQDMSTPPTDFSLVGHTTGASNRCGALYWKRATGSESGTIAFTNGGTGSVTTGGRIYAIRYALASGTPYEAHTTTAEASSTTITQLSVTSTDVLRLAIHVTSYGAATTATAFSGESNGDFTEPVAESTSGSMGFQIQTAAMAAATTISGGTATLGSAAVKIRHVIAMLPGIY